MDPPFTKLPDGFDYIIFQREKCPTSGRLHWQGFIITTKRTRFSALKKLLPKARIEGMRAKDTDLARDYCRKSNTQQSPPTEFGAYVRSRTGRRTDIERWYADIIAGMSLKDLYKYHTTCMFRHGRAFERLRDILVDGEPGGVPAPVFKKVILIVGPPGTGKTSLFWERTIEAGGSRSVGWTPPFDKSYRWFDKYRGQTHVCFDDFVGQVKLDLLLKLLHEHPEQVPYKGGFVWWYPTHIYITSNFHPYKWYKWEWREEHRLALCRRIHTIHYRYGLPNQPSTWTTITKEVSKTDPLSTFDDVQRLMEQQQQ